MTPQQKALELRQEFVFRINEYIEPKTWDEVESLNTLIYKAAKDCAELCAAEILDEIQPFELGYEYDTKIKYWNDVINEIDSL